MLKKFLSHLPGWGGGDAGRGQEYLASSSKVKPRTLQSSANSSPGHSGIPADRRDPNTLPHCWTVSSHGTMENICDIVELASLKEAVRPRDSLVTPSGHHFRLLDCQQPTSCDLCQQPAYSGVHRCARCHTTCHTDCSQRVQVPCLLPRQLQQQQQEEDEQLSPYEPFETARDLGEQFAAYTPRLRDSAQSYTFPRRSAKASGSSDTLLSGQNSLLLPSSQEEEDAYSTASQELLSASAQFSLLSPEFAYSLSSLDRRSIAAAGIRVIESPPSQLHSPEEVSVRHLRQPDGEFFHAWTPEKLNAHLFLLADSLHGQEFRLCPAARARPQLRFKGSLRVFVNLLRPIRMDQPSCTFFLPRGNACLLHDVACDHTAEDVIGLLLSKHRIRDPAHKFAIFEHEIQGDRTVQVRKLERQEKPLVLLLSWTQLPPQEMRLAFERKKLILQENESSVVDWNAFSVPELNNFLRILEMEEKQHREDIRLKFEIRRQQLLRRLVEVQAEQRNESEA